MSTDDIRDLGAVDGPIPGRDGGPQDEEAMAAAEGLTAAPETARSYQEMLERGAAQRGEGRVR
jgi:hypothetical protein